MNTAVLCTAFGTARISSLAPFSTVLRKIENRFPSCTAQWAFTSRFARKNLAEQGVVIDSPAEAVRKLEQFQRIIVQPFQIVSGGEYDKTVQEITSCGLQNVTIGSPLIRSESDIPMIAELMVRRKRELYRQIESLIVGVHGNGNHHTDQLYRDLDLHLQKIDPRYLCASLETEPGIDSAVHALAGLQAKSAVILPLLFSAGKHVKEDMGEQWVRLLSEQGITGSADLTPIGEIDSFLNIWFDRLEKLMDSIS